MKLDFLNRFDFFSGVPDSLLQPFCNYLMCKYGIDGRHHIIAANEGNAVALGAGYHLSTGKVPVVYLQNSGEGNIINPVASLLNDKVYGIPCLFIIGWRGEPGVHDEPQHIYQGAVTVKLLENMNIQTKIISKETKESEVEEKLNEWDSLFANGKQAAFVVKKGAFEFDKKPIYKNDYTLTREDVIKHIVLSAGDDLIVSTTGKASRELFEIREENHQEHGKDFLTVGSMGHSSSIALEVAFQHPEKRIWCIDGDGAVLMHMGAMAVIGAMKPKNLIHLVINNGAHESVGGLPTVGNSIDIVSIAKACGYESAVTVDNFQDLQTAISNAGKSSSLFFIEVKCAIGSRENLGRPTTTAKENKINFMKSIFN